RVASRIRCQASRTAHAAANDHNTRGCWCTRGSSTSAASAPVNAGGSTLTGARMIVSAPSVALGRRRNLQLVRRAGPRGPEEQGAAVGQREVAPVGPMRAVLRPVAVDDDDGPGKQRLLGEPAAEEHVRRPSFDGPRFLGAAGLLDV